MKETTDGKPDKRAKYIRRAIKRRWSREYGGGQIMAAVDTVLAERRAEIDSAPPVTVMPEQVARP